MTTTTEAAIETIATLAPQVASAHEAQSAAFDEQIAAEAALLSRVVELARPALRALANRIQIGDRTWWPTNVQTATEREFADVSGVIVRGQPLPTRDYPRANSGSYDTSEALYLLTDGTFVEKSWTGNWSRWQGAGDEAHAVLTPKTAAEVVDEYDVDEIIAALAAKLQQQAAGNAGKTTEAAKARAAKMQAVVAILS